MAEAVCSRLEEDINVEDVRLLHLSFMGELRAKMFVNPQIMHVSAEMTLLHLGLDDDEELKQLCRQELNSIYEEDVPPIFPTTIPALRFLGELKNLRIVVVTHAGEEWTNKKLNAYGIKDLVDHVYCLSVDGPKGEDQWQEVILSEQVSPKEVIVVGDSLKSDVLPNFKIGVPAENIYRVKSEYGNSGEPLPNGVKEVADLGGFIDCLVSGL
jgi:FMN phosphatase YigB (HAD superfamily)